MIQSTLSTIPASSTVRQRMQACREELDALKRLLRAAEAAEKADVARRQRQQLESATVAGEGGDQ